MFKIEGANMISDGFKMNFTSVCNMYSCGIFSMLPSETYFSNHTLQFRDVDKLLKKYSRFIKWNSVQKVVDIGCGPGDVTHDLLLPLIPINAELVRNIPVFQTFADDFNVNGCIWLILHYIL